MLKYIAEQIGANPTTFTLYARREETRRNHVAHLMSYLKVRPATAEDRRAALLAAIEAAASTESGDDCERRRRHAAGTPSSLPTVETIERMALAARAIVRRRAEIALMNVWNRKNCKRSTGCWR